MNDPTIPTHHLPDRSRIPTIVERILPSKEDVINDVHRHDFHELFLFIKGTGEHMVDLEHCPITAPTIHLVAPGQVHQLNRSKDMEGLVVMFARDALPGQGRSSRSDLFNRSDSPWSFRVHADQLEEGVALVHSMEHELSLSEGPLAEVVEGYLAILLIKCAHWSRKADPRSSTYTDANDPVRRFLGLVESGYLEERSVGHYADQLALSADHLNTLVKERSGRTASTLIKERLLLEAKRRLLHGDLSIKEVGYSLNMNDPAYFTRWFRKCTGTTPATYRKHIREKYQH